MKRKKRLEDDVAWLYQNVDYIYMYFEDALAPGLRWIRTGNLMHLETNKLLKVSYDTRVFKEI